MKTLEKLIEDQARWSNLTFGRERSGVGPIKHLRNECDEVLSAFDIIERAGAGEDSIFRLREELADCFLLLLDATRRFDVSFEELVEAAALKQAANRQRTWNVGAGVDEPVEHVREPLVKIRGRSR